MHQIKKKAKILRSNKFVGRSVFRSIDWIIYVRLAFFCLTDLLAHGTIAKYHCTPKRHVLQNKSSKCYRKLRTRVYFSFSLSVFHVFLPYLALYIPTPFSLLKCNVIFGHERDRHNAPIISSCRLTVSIDCSLQKRQR